MKYLDNLLSFIFESINTQDDTATAGEDYDSLVSHQVTFNPGGDIVRTIPINIREDILVERLEEFTAVLSSTTPLVQIGNISSTRIRIVDNDGMAVNMSEFSLGI